MWIWETYLDDTVGGSSDNDFECVAVLNGHDGDVKAVTFCPSHGIWGDGPEIVLSASYDDTIRVWAEDDGDWEQFRIDSRGLSSSAGCLRVRACHHHLKAPL